MPFIRGEKNRPSEPSNDERRNEKKGTKIKVIEFFMKSERAWRIFWISFSFFFLSFFFGKKLCWNWRLDSTFWRAIERKIKTKTTEKKDRKKIGKRKVNYWYNLFIIVIKVKKAENTKKKKNEERMSKNKIWIRITIKWSEEERKKRGKIQQKTKVWKLIIH